MTYLPELWPTNGPNTVEVCCTHRDDKLAAEVELAVRDVELEVKYLKGKAWHRGEDPDLGPSQLQDTRPRL